MGHRCLIPTPIAAASVPPRLLMIEASIPVGSPEQLILLFGTSDQHLRRIRESTDAKITTKGGKIHVSGPEPAVLSATAIFEQMRFAVGRDGSLQPEQVDEIVSKVLGKSPRSSATPVEVRQPGLAVRARTPGQGAYIEAIRNHDLVFCIGPAGTGKTYLAVATAIESLKAQQIRKIVLVRPAVEAGESLGYLPGDLLSKINPYLRPLLDALGEMMDYDQVKRYMADDVIEVVPLAYMRGRTLNNAFIIMDEAQNTTVSQMKMFLTRMGANSRVVVSGDTSQVDLPSHTRSGLTDAMARLKRIEGCAQVVLTKADIVRHRLVEAIVRSYEEGTGR
ncbi:MAG: PhoH family protein [Aeoliella sp.]